MAIVKIFPEDQNRSDFSIRLIAEKYHVYEGDKLLRSNLLSIEQGVKEVDNIISERLKNKLVSVKVSHQGFEAEEKPVTRYKRNHTFTKRNCENCGEEFDSIRSNHIVCSRNCSHELYQKKQNSNGNLFEDESESISKPETIVLESEETLRAFDELTKKAQSDKKRENYFKDLLSIIIGSRVYAGEMERPYEFNVFLKNLLRLNLVYYNNVNIFHLMPSLFKLEKGVIIPVDYDLWTSKINQEKALKDVMKTMLEMNTYPTHQQQNSFSGFAICKELFDDIVTINNRVEVLLTKVQSLSKEVNGLKNIETPSQSDEKKSWFKF
jgi:predicted  nucleic acid-binding Zn-ribbon protein